MTTTCACWPPPGQAADSVAGEGRSGTDCRPLIHLLQHGRAASPRCSKPTVRGPFGPLRRSTAACPSCYCGQLTPRGRRGSPTHCDVLEGTACGHRAPARSLQKACALSPAWGRWHSGGAQEGQPGVHGGHPELLDHTVAGAVAVVQGLEHLYSVTSAQKLGQG